MNHTADAVERLIRDVRWAMEVGLGPRDLVPMLEKVLREAGADANAVHFARRHLAPLIVSKAPWRAARLCRDVLQREDHDETWAVLGLAYTLIGHYHGAVYAYRQALLGFPRCPRVLHNLGHLLDAALDRSADALKYLKLARKVEPADVEIAASYAHALLRSGQREAALAELLAVEVEGERAQQWIARWTAAPSPGA